MERMQAAAPSGRLARLFFAATALLVAALAARYAWLWMFSHFQLYDDEGYFEVLVRHLLVGRRIYDEVATVYGPAWLAWRWLANGVLGVPLDTDGVRWLTWVLWLACALVTALLAWRAARGAAAASWCALVAGAFAVLHLSALANEPGHPQDLALLVFLGALLAWDLLRERRAGLAALVAGLAIGILAWTKVNLGLYAALPFALLLCLDARSTPQRALGWLALIAAVALPWLLMRTHLGEAWAPGLSTVVGAGLLAAVSFLPRSPRSPRGRELCWLAAGVALASLASLGFALAHGSTLAGLWRALVLLPARFTTEIVIGIRVPGSAVWIALAALFAALFVRLRADALPRWLVPLAELVFGLFTLANLAPHPEWLIPLVLPCAWLVLVPRETRTRRLPLVLCAALQALQVFPVSGSQEALGTALLVPLAALALCDGCTALAGSPAAARMRRGAALLPALLATLYIGGLHFGNARGIEALRATGFERVALPGVRHTRFEENTGARARFLADTLRGQFDAFLSVRGDNSLYGWTGIVPSTGVLVSHSWRLFDAQQQQELAAAYERAPNTLVLDNAERIAPELRASLPFFGMLQRSYRAVLKIGADVLCVQRQAPIPNLSSCVILPEALLARPLARLALRWPRGANAGSLGRIQVANLLVQQLYADSALPDARAHPRIFDGQELLFDGLTKLELPLERLAGAREPRLELPQPLPPETASFALVRFFAPDGTRLCSLPIVIALRGS